MENENFVQNKSLSGFTGFLERLGGILLEPRKTFYDMMQRKMSIIEPLFLIIAFWNSCPFWCLNSQNALFFS